MTLLCGRLTDLRHLITNGVADCNVLLILATKGFFTRPWCLLEARPVRIVVSPSRRFGAEPLLLWQVLEAERRGVPVVLATIVGRGFNVAEVRVRLNHNRAEM